MANDFSNLFQNILKFGALALRENSIMPRLVSQDFGPEEAQKGQVINISIPRPKTTENVAPGAAQTGNDRQHDLHPITMDQWKQSSFNITDKEEREVFEQGILPADSSEAIKALMNEVDNYIINKMLLKMPYTVGSAAPVAVADIVDARTAMVKQLAPVSGLNYIMNPDTEGAMLKLGTFHQADQSGNLAGLQEGNLGRKFGFQMFMDQNLTGKTLVSGTKAGTILTNGAIVVGQTAIPIDGGTVSTTLVPGDTVKFAGDPNTYIVTNSVASVLAGTMNIFPPAKVAIGDGAVVTPIYTASQIVTYHSIASHPTAFGFVNRPMRVARDGLGVVSTAIVDPITGLSLRLEVTRNNKQDNWSWDILYGGDVVRPEFGAFNTAIV